MFYFQKKQVEAYTPYSKKQNTKDAPNYDKIMTFSKMGCFIGAYVLLYTYRQSTHTFRRILKGVAINEKVHIQGLHF